MYVKGLPLVNIIIGGIFALGFFAALNMAEMLELPAVVLAPAGLFLSAILFVLTQKTMRKRERDWKFALEQFIKRFEKVDEEEKKAQEAGGIVFAVYYLGGHPNHKASSAGDFGNMSVYEKQIAFRATRFDRFQIKMARLKKVSIESEATLLVKRIKHLQLKPIKNEERKKLAGRLKAEIRKRMKFLLFEYQDDLGEKMLIAFRPIAGNPLEAKSIKEAVDYQLTRYRMQRSKEEKRDRIEAREKVQEAPRETPREVPSEPVSSPLAPARPPAPSPTKNPPSTAKLPPPKAPSGAGALRPDGIPIFDIPSSPLMGPQIEAAPVVPSTRATGVFRTADLLAAMKEQKYDVVFLSGGRTEEEKAQMSEKMAQEFNFSLDQASAVIDRAPIVAKKALSYADAEQLASSFLAIGAQVKIEATK
ncbi:MAG TPA: hypothetical protein DD435_01585 [Cyanobacteria bacterium UBA8530]|nr:hypothetical protein [Cyanobacteria bacterium UBA8530]